MIDINGADLFGQHRDFLSGTGKQHLCLVIKSLPRHLAHQFPAGCCQRPGKPVWVSWIRIPRPFLKDPGRCPVPCPGPERHMIFGKTTVTPRTRLPGYPAAFLRSCRPSGAKCWPSQSTQRISVRRPALSSSAPESLERTKENPVFSARPFP